MSNFYLSEIRYLLDHKEDRGSQWVSTVRIIKREHDILKESPTKVWRDRRTNPPWVLLWWSRLGQRVTVIHPWLRLWFRIMTVNWIRMVIVERSLKVLGMIRRQTPYLTLDEKRRWLILKVPTTFPDMNTKPGSTKSLGLPSRVNTNRFQPL